jgi:type VI secretion system protein ImpI
MMLTLTIENETNLPDGGPLSVKVSGKRGLDIGRDSHLDWTLPDPTRFISSKHAEIRYREGGYWLHDVSTNGTFLNGGDHRMQAPHCLRTGDRFTIGHYIIVAAVDAEQAEAAPSMAAPTPQAAAYQQLWDNEHEVAPPIDRSQLRPPRERAAPVNPDFLDWAADVPNPFHAAPPPAQQAPVPGPANPSGEEGWAVGPMSHVPLPPPAQPDMPAPRRPVWTSEPQAPWAGEEGVPSKADVGAPAGRDFASAPIRPDLGIEPFSAGASAGERAGVRSAPPEAFLRRLAQAAGVSEDIFANKDAAELADQLGAVMRLVIDNVMQLLNARVQAKRLARSSQHTMIQAIDNNPLKFSPSAEEALRIMFGPQTRSYLDARRAIEQGFEDLKTHQIKTYSAMQHALTTLMAGLDPDTLAREADADRGIADLMVSRKAKRWDAYVARWQGQVLRDGSGLVDAFMLLFADYYDREGQ